MAVSQFDCDLVSLVSQVVHVTTEKDRRIKEEIAENGAQLDKFLKQQAPLSKVHCARCVFLSSHVVLSPETQDFFCKRRGSRLCCCG